MSKEQLWTREWSFYRALHFVKVNFDFWGVGEGCGEGNAHIFSFFAHTFFKLHTYLEILLEPDKCTRIFVAAYIFRVKSWSFREDSRAVKKNEDNPCAPKMDILGKQNQIIHAIYSIILFWKKTCTA